MRWTSGRKAEIVVAIERGLITTEEAKRRYELSDEELAAWTRAYATYGRYGLHVTKLRERTRPAQSANRRHPSGEIQ
jgi:Protein of unknown function (DUF1153)